MNMIKHKVQSEAESTNQNPWPITSVLTWCLCSVYRSSPSLFTPGFFQLTATTWLGYRTLRHQDTLGHFGTDLKTLRHQKCGTRPGHFDSGQFRFHWWFGLNFGTNFVVPKCLVAEVSGSPWLCYVLGLCVMVRAVFVSWHSRFGLEQKRHVSRTRKY